MIGDSSDNAQRRDAGAAATPPGSLSRRVTYLLRRVTDAAGRMANAQLAPLGIDTRHYTVLAVVTAEPAASQRSIADTLGLDRATVVALVDVLEEQGLARRVRSRQDRRVNGVEVTPRGRRVLKRADALMEECEQKFIAALPLAERKQLTSMLERLLAFNLRD